MKKIFCLIFLIFIPLLVQYSFGQKMPIDYFDEGNGFIENEKYKKAIVSFQYIVDHHNTNSLYPRALYNLGYACFKDMQYDRSIKALKPILFGNFDEKESLGGSVMDDPYTNYRHRASEMLSDIYTKLKIYDTALYYFSLADTVYPYIHFCGNELEAKAAHKALTYSYLFQKLGKNDQAIQSLLPAVFVTLVPNYSVIADLKKLLKGKKGLKQELEKALMNIYSKKVQYEDKTHEQYYFRFLNTEIYIPYGYWGSDKFNEEEAIQAIKQSDLWIMIVEL